MVNLGMGVLRTIAAFCAGMLLDKFGRKSLYLTGNTLIMISMALLGVGLNYEIPYLSKSMVLLFALGTTLSFALINPTYLAECLPFKAIAYLVVLDNLEGFSILKNFEMIAGKIGRGNAIYIFAIISFIGHFALIFKLKETKGMTLHQIYELYTSNKKYAKPVQGNNTSGDYKPINRVTGTTDDENSLK